MKGFLPSLFCTSLVLAASIAAHAQCTSTVTTFPYSEDFEGGPAWTSGGTNSDWVWGTPAHPTINAASEGIGAWCVGGLTGSFYSNGQQSWLETPCFDLSTLNYPWIRFAIWWETEPNYDGVGLQYSPNGGTTWINVGEEGENEDCHLRNWFNSSNITALNLASPRNGWSGTTITGGCANGGGSGGYVYSAHCLDDIPTADPVKFRFIFGAGTICNTFDGVAIDEFYVGEALPLDPAYTFTCSGNTVSFQATGLYSCEESGIWNFGDPASGGANTAVGAQVDHTYPGPGEYQVSFTMTSSCSAPATITRTVVIADLEFDITDVGCLPNSGEVIANVSGGVGPYTYGWEPGGGTTPSIEGLAAGDYTVLVQAPDMCPIQATATVGTDGATVSAEVVHVDAQCQGLANGSATVTATGGAGNYTYLWSPSGGSAATATNLASGDYSCVIEDDVGCSVTVEVTIAEPAAVVVVAMDDAVSCAGQDVLLQAEGSGGTGDLAYAWTPSGPEVSPSETTVYEVVATDANGCASEPDQVTVAVGDAPEPVFTWDMSQGCVPLCVTFTDMSASAGTRSWAFGDGTLVEGVASVEHCFQDAGLYSVALTITTAEGCDAVTSEDDIITVFASPVALFGTSPDVASIEAPTFQFLDRSIGATSWSWSFGDPASSTSTAPSPTFTYSDVGCYSVQMVVSNEGGCVAALEDEVCVEDVFALYAPNAFTADGDLINDVFGVVTTVRDPEDFLLLIHDRWGREIFKTTDPYKGWDGLDTPIGVYAWSVRLRDREGDVRQRQGHVTLLR